MNRAIPVFALALIVIGVVGLGAVGFLTQVQGSFTANSQINNSPNGMMGSDMMGEFDGMMNGNGRMMGSAGGMMNGGMMGIAPNTTPVPLNQPIDREIKIVTRNSQFDPVSVAVKKGETVKFTLVNQDAVAHNFISQDGNIAYVSLPPNATQSVVWVAPGKGTYTALCTLHAGMKMQVVVE